MKSRIISLLTSLFLTGFLSAQNNALIPEASYVGDVVRNFSGGIKRGTTYLGLANFKLSFNTDNARLWKGGLFFINAANAHGGDPSADLTGDFHTVSNIEADDITYIHELWYRQTFNKLEVIAGLQDLNSEFVSSEYGSMFINSTFGTPSTIADNVPSPIFPLTAVGISLKWNASLKNSFKVAVFDGLPTDFEHNPYNLNWDLEKDEGFLAVTEYQFSGNNGSYRAGIYHHSQLIETVEDNRYYYNHGFYIIADQMVYSNQGRDGGIGVFGQVAFSPKAFNAHNIYTGMGLSWQGPFTKRGEDKLGIAFTYAGFNDDSRKDESVVEVFYKAQLTENIFIQPDFQYVINPEGTDQNLRNAMVGFVRFGLSF